MTVAAFPTPRTPLENLDAETGILGAALYENDLVMRLDALEARHFAEPTHGRLWATIQGLVADGQPADPVTVLARAGRDDGVRGMGAGAWLADLCASAPALSVAEGYARIVIELAQRREVIATAQEAIEAARTGTPAAALIGDMEASLLAMQKGDRRATLVSASEAADDVLAYLDQPEDHAGGVLTGLAPLDDHLGRLHPDELILLAGRPGMGKSALGGAIALNIARAGHGVIEINAEMSTAQMMRRHLTDLAFSAHGRDAPAYKDIKRRQVSHGQRMMLEDAVEKIRAMPLALVKRTGLTLSALRSLIRRQASIWAGQGITLGAITIDHVGLLQADGGGKDRYADQTNIAIGMKALADELHVPVIAMVQLNRRVEEREARRPMLSDLRDSGAWEENADTVIGVYRDAYYALKEPEPKDDGRPGSMLKWQEWDKRRKSRVIEAILLKVREGEESTIPLWASIGHNAIRGGDPIDEGSFL